jgi:6-phosphogluconolactonase/glucosamine-6-phosphate isomerase/deaminase
MNMWEWVPIIQPALRDTSRSAFIDRTGIERYHLLDETRDPHQVATEMSREINSAPVHVAFAGMGENGHLAVNGPPADFETQDGFLFVELDEACRNFVHRSGSAQSPRSKSVFGRPDVTHGAGNPLCASTRIQRSFWTLIRHRY